LQNPVIKQKCGQPKVAQNTTNYEDLKSLSKNLQKYATISVQWRWLLVIIFIKIKLLNSMDTHKHRSKEKLSI